MAGILRVDQANVDYIYAKTSGAAVYIPGHIIQVQQTDLLSVWSATSATPVDVTGLSVSITPKSASSKILIYVSMNIGVGDDNYVYTLLMRNGVAVGSGTGASGNRVNCFLSITQTALGTPNTWRIHNVNRSFLDSPATTSTLTYKIQMASPYLTAAMYLNRQSNDGDNSLVQRPGSCISAMEIAQ